MIEGIVYSYQTHVYIHSIIYMITISIYVIRLCHENPKHFDITISSNVHHIHHKSTFLINQKSVDFPHCLKDIGMDYGAFTSFFFLSRSILIAARSSAVRSGHI